MSYEDQSWYIHTLPSCKETSRYHVFVSRGHPYNDQDSIFMGTYFTADPTLQTESGHPSEKMMKWSER